MEPKERVLVLTASAEDLRQIEGLLSPEGIEVVPARGLAEALEQQAAAPISTILYDADALEDWRGALPQLLCACPSCRVVLLSRLADVQMWADLLEAGGYDLLIKPLHPQELRFVVRCALRRKYSAAA